MVKSAVIVAGGRGARLKEHTEHQPKGFLEVEGISLVKRSISKLLKAGIEKIYIGTGYCSEMYDALAESYPEISCTRSDRYETTSSMFTFYNMRDVIKEDFILLESDLLYEKNALRYLLDDPRKDIVLASGETKSEDEVYIQTDEKSDLVAMSKIGSELDSLDAELVGITKISLERYAMMCEAFENQDNQRIDYEYVMVMTSKKIPFPVKKIDDLAWCEIDDETHLERALAKILPRIEEREALS